MPSRLAAAARSAGAVNKEAEGDKRDRYPNDRVVWPARAFGMETFGRVGISALRLVRKLARACSVSAELADAEALPSRLLLQWGCRLSVALQRANVRNLHRCLGHSLAAAQR